MAPKSSGAKRKRADDAALVTLADPAGSHPRLQAMQQRLCDVVLIADGRRFDAHRAILAVSSDYMSAIMENARFCDTQETLSSTKSTLNLSSTLLKYIYEGSCRMHPDQLEDIVSTASRLQIRSLLYAAKVELVKLA